MSRFRFVINSLVYYFKSNLLVALGVAVSTMVLTGSLIIGDSIRFSLKQSVFYRLGNTTHVISVNERYFRKELAGDIENLNPSVTSTPVLLLGGIAFSEGGINRVNKVQIVGVDNDFVKISGSETFSHLKPNEIILGKNLAQRLKAEVGSEIKLVIQKASLIPLNAPFVSDRENSVSFTASVAAIADENGMGNFNLKNSQVSPYNVFISLSKLNRLMGLTSKANTILIKTGLHSEDIEKAIAKCLKPEDMGLIFNPVSLTGETEIISDRVFIEDRISEVLLQMKNSSPVTTYFVNAINRVDSNFIPPAKGKNKFRDSLPYSFISTWGHLKINEVKELNNTDIILNSWAASELNLKTGDSLQLVFYEIEPLRQLVVKNKKFRLKKIVPMEGNWADSTLMPRLPGLSNAGHCREWETGIPIDLNVIKDRDEEYWKKWKGAPKAFVSNEMALNLWSNRFGNYTSFRFPRESFDKIMVEKELAEKISFGDVGITLSPVRENAIDSSQSGTDFGGLFIGLSFFILVASLVLTALLFRFNIENRAAQVGTLHAVGFGRKQINRFYLSENVIVALVGGIAGLLFAFLYSKLVFMILNTLWNDIVRTGILFVKIVPSTLLLGFSLGVSISVITVLLVLRNINKKQVVSMKYPGTRESDLKKNKYLRSAMVLTLLTAFILLGWQLLIAGKTSTSVFFLTGILLLAGLLLLFRATLSRPKIPRALFSQKQLVLSNIIQNRNRSFTIVTLFALAVFMVVAIGSNKSDLISGSGKKSDGTGGFHFFAETTIPVLFDLKSPEKRAEEGIYGIFDVIQFSRVEGDDASCLNLNKISQPSVLGVVPAELAGRFSFAVKDREIRQSDPWLMLDTVFDDGSIPAIADQTVIQWGLEKKVGDLLYYRNEAGDSLKLRLIAGTKPSVFQGFIIISQKHFLKNFPASSGSKVFLVEAQDNEPHEKVSTENKQHLQEIADELNSVFRDYGWDMHPASERLAGFYSVTNTYLSIFLALGAFALLLGTFGLAVVVARTLIERRRETALLLALGFTPAKISQIVFWEYAALLIAGILIGTFSAMIAVFPALASSNTDASPLKIAMIATIILVNGLFWIFVINSRINRKNKFPALSLNTD